MIFDFSSAIGPSAIGSVSASLPLRAFPDPEPRAVSDPGAGFLDGDVLDGFLDGDVLAAREGFFWPAFDVESLDAPEAVCFDDALRPALRPVTGFARFAASLDSCFFSPTACLISLRPGAAFCLEIP